jgi:metacaspase-1
MKAFAWFMKDVRKGDILLFHFSGHEGLPDKTGHEIDGYNETIIPVDYDGQILWGSLVYKLPLGAKITALRICATLGRV